MTLTIDPVDFARLMTMNAHDRHDILEFLGSTRAGRAGAAALLHRNMNGPLRADADAGRGDSARRIGAH